MRRDALRAAKAFWVWQWVRLRTAGTDPEGRGLERIRDYVRVQEGALPPAYGDPRQRPPGYLASLRAEPWHDPAGFPGARTLASAWEAIRDEALALDRAGRFTLRSPATRSGEPLYEGGAWRTCQLSIMGSALDAHLRLCPATAAALEAVRERSATGHVYFSAIGPGTRFAPHGGETNVRLRLHLGLVVPPGCTLTTGGETRPPEEGRCVVFDNSFQNHARNEGDATWYTLVVDVWHPELRPREIAALEELMRISRAAAASRRRARERARTP